MIQYASKRKYYYDNFRAQAMRPTGREGGGEIAQRWQSVMSTIALFYFCVACFCCLGFSFLSTRPRDWLGRTSPK